FFESWIQLRRLFHNPRKRATRCGCDSRIIGRGVEGDAEVACFSSETVRVDGESRIFGSAPAAVVIDHLQEWRFITPRDPMDGGWLAEHVRAIAREAYDGFVRSRELHSDRRAAIPAERARSRGE